MSSFLAFSRAQESSADLAGARYLAGAGISDWQSYYGQNQIDQWMIPFFGASLYDNPKAYAKSSAINFIKHTKWRWV